jgi:uncharacterized protein
MTKVSRLARRVFVAASLAAATGRAQELEPRTVPSRNVESFSYRSPTMGNRYDISVGMPNSFTPVAGRKYPALVVLDGNQTFPLALEASRNLRGTIGDLFVISIGSPFEEGDESFTRRRIYEFSTDWNREDPFGREVTRFCTALKSAPGKCVGGAPKFLAFIVSEVLPKVLAKYPIDPNNLGLFGLSAGGFFAIYTIFQPSSPFTKYIIASPAMAYGDGEAFRLEERYAASNKDLKVGIYLSAGSLEADDPTLEGIGKIFSGQAHLSAMLRSRKYPGLTLVTEILPGLGHSDGAGTALVRGMRTLYAMPVR